MQFRFTSEQTLIDDTVERLFADRADQRADSGAPSVWQQLAELGLLGAALPESVGGSGGGTTEQMILAQRLGRHLVASPFLSSTVIAAQVLQAALSAGNGAAFAQERLCSIADGSQCATLAVFEQTGRYDWQASQASAAPDASGYVVTGTKHYVMDASAADYLIVAAREAQDGQLVLLATPRDATGISISTYEAFDGTDLATVTFDNVAIDQSQLLAGPERGETVLADALAMGAFAASAEILGACEAAFEKTIEYLRVREQFGRPLSSFQALQHRASDLHAEMEMLRSLVLGASQTLAEGLNEQSRADAMAAMVMAAQVGDHVGREAIQMHGAVGMTRDLGVGRYLMRINALARLLGDADEYRLRYFEFVNGAS